MSLMCTNFRDVGEAVELVSDEWHLPAGRILRGGKLDFVVDLQDVGSPKTILNLRRGVDPVFEGSAVVHLPAPKQADVYDTPHPRIRRWLAEVLAVFVCETTRFPVLVHCASGKDRTGVVVAALLLVLGMQREHVVEEYLLSEGEIALSLIDGAIDGIGDVDEYLREVDLVRLRSRLLTV